MPVMNAAGGWYSSGTFWAAAGVVVAVLAAVAVVWVTLAVGFGGAPTMEPFWALAGRAPPRYRPGRFRCGK